MKIKSAQFVRPITLNAPINDDMKPLFVFMGRSNVGKSTLINTITNKKDLCRSGGTPGVTKNVNIFLINQNIYFADLPGYGYAKISKGERKKLEELIFWFLQNASSHISEIFLLADSRIGLTDLDKEIIDFLGTFKVSLTLILSKTDKINQAQLQKTINNIKKLYHNIRIIPFSVKDPMGRKEILRHILM